MRKLSHYIYISFIEASLTIPTTAGGALLAASTSVKLIRMRTKVVAPMAPKYVAISCKGKESGFKIEARH